jgi:uncharacterized iron-regulated membrane protein
MLTLIGTLITGAYVWWLRKRPEAGKIMPPPIQETAIIPPLVGQPAMEENETPAA